MGKQTDIGRVAITGGSGRLGRWVVDYFMARGEVTVVDVQPPEQRGVGYAPASVLDFAALERALAGHDSVVHLAAIPNQRTAPASVTFEVNVQGTWNTLQASENVGIRRAAVASSDAATGLHYNPPDWAPQYLPVDEAHPLRPTDVYSLSKQVTETICRAYAVRGKLRVAAIRPSRIIYPPHWHELEEWGADPRNHHMWAYVEPEDVARALWLALVLEGAPYDVFFVGADDTLSQRPTLEVLEERFGRLPEVRKPEVYERNPMASVFDNSRARRVLGLEATSRLEAVGGAGGGRRPHPLLVLSPRRICWRALARAWRSAQVPRKTCPSSWRLALEAAGREALRWLGAFEGTG